MKLQLKNISKRYHHPVIDNFSYDFTKGSYAICGKNGSGKSTLLTIMSGSTSYDKGQVVINGFCLAKQPVLAKQHISFIPDKHAMYPFITGDEFLRFVSAIKKSQFNHDTHDLIARFALTPFMNVKFSEMSLGTQKKFMIVAATIGDSSVWIMDEPTNGLDLLSEQIFFDYLAQYVESKILIMATHEQEVVTKLNATIIQL